MVRLREEVDAHQHAYSQSKYATIDSVNREEVQYIFCASGPIGVNRAMASGNAWHERTSELGCGFSREYIPFQW